MVRAFALISLTLVQTYWQTYWRTRYDRILQYLPCSHALPFAHSPHPPPVRPLTADSEPLTHDVNAPQMERP